ncbi:hypothetical protein E4N85_05465 [Treponema denticola]|uniref:hypothetical protein n=1 Tax=Treponema denticola TaxID=158 RepID=UPI0020A2F02E|nr:hypothetical protein [Treponema denticola]UTC95206.1 hypothetical protein E4N85_05465 [Treponema denticola]
MRKVFLFYIVFICLFFFSACSNQEKRLKKLWDFENSINYQNFSKSEMDKIEKLMKMFSQEEKYNKESWSSGYSQQCYVLRKLYYEEIISKEDFLNKCVNVYTRYAKNQTKLSFHMTGFAVCLYYLGQTEKASEIFIEILENGTEKEFGSKSNYEISLFICRKLLNENNEFDSEDFYSDMGEEDIINVFCGN